MYSGTQNYLYADNRIGKGKEMSRMIPEYVQRRALDSTRGERQAIVIPEDVINAQRVLSKNFPQMYNRISAWRNRGILTESEVYELQVFAHVYRYNWLRIEPFIHRFLNVSKVIDDPEPIEKQHRKPSINPMGRKLVLVD